MQFLLEDKFPIILSNSDISSLKLVNIKDIF